MCPESAAAPVLVVGEALVDVVERAGTHHETPGGSPMNVAVGLSRLGHRTRLVTSLGQDDRGEIVLRHIRESGVEPAVTPLARTSSAVATIAPDGSATYEFDLDWFIDPVEVPDATALVHVGSIATALRPGADTLADLATSLPVGTLLSVDPNVRPSITPDRDAVLPLTERLFTVADVVKMSDEDAAWLYPGRSVDAVIDHVLTFGVPLVAITLGGDGCVVATASNRLRRQAPRVAVADTIGAGDSFMAGLLSWLLDRGADAASPDAAPPDAAPTRADLARLDDARLSDLARFAMACSAITVGRPGADPPTRAELQGS